MEDIEGFLKQETYKVSTFEETLYAMNEIISEIK